MIWGKSKFDEFASTAIRALINKAFEELLAFNLWSVFGPLLLRCHALPTSSPWRVVGCLPDWKCVALLSGSALLITNVSSSLLMCGGPILLLCTESL